MEIWLKDVNKSYGSKHALKDISLKIPQGMFGLLGRNGAGKTTLMKTLATLLKADSGEISVCGTPVKDAAKIREMTGYLPQDFSMYGNMGAYEAMDYLGVLSGLTKTERRERIPVLLERVRFRNLLCETAEERIVILSTHIVGDIEATCENIAVMDDGEIIYKGTVTELLAFAEGNIYTADISRMELEKVKQEYLVTGMLTQGSHVTVRFLLREPSQRLFEGAVPCEVSVEDAYLYLMYRKRGDVSCF